MLKSSYILCTRNRIDDVKRLFDTIFIQTYLPDEFVIVDSSDNDLTKDYIDSIRSKIKSNIVYIKSEPGLTLQRNIGISTAIGDVLIFTDDDGILEKDYIENIMKCYEDDSVMGVGTQQTNYVVKSKISSFTRRLFLLSRADGNGTLQRSGYPALQFMSNKDTIADTEILGGFCSYRKVVFNDFKYDENLKGYGLMEDVEFSYRVSRKYRLVYNPFARVYHNESKTERINHRKLLFMYIYNNYYLTKKNMGMSYKNIPFVLWAYLGICIRAAATSCVYRTLDPILGIIDGVKKVQEVRRKK